MGKKRKNPFVDDVDHSGPMKIRDLVDLVLTNKNEFPYGLETFIKIGDIEGNHGVNGYVTVAWHRPFDIVLSIDPNAGETDYGETEEDRKWQ